MLKQKLEWLKNNVWYVFLLCGSTFYIGNNLCLIDTFEKMNVPKVVFVLWILLLIYPLIAEFEFLGLKVKKEVKKATEEQEKRIQSIQNDLHEMRMETAVNNQINVGLDKLLPREGLEQLLSKDFKAKKEDEHEITSPIKYIDENNVYLFQVRANLEITLHMLCEKLGNTNRLNFSQSIGWLVRAGAIDGYIGRLIHEIIKIATRGVHGESVSSEYIDFVRKTYPEVIKIIEDKLKDENLSFMSCDRCGYRGFSAVEDFCPRCGFTNLE